MNLISDLNRNTSRAVNCKTNGFNVCRKFFLMDRFLKRFLVKVKHD